MRIRGRSPVYNGRLAARDVHQAAIRSTEKDTEFAEVKFFDHHANKKKLS